MKFVQHGLEYYFLTIYLFIIKVFMLKPKNILHINYVL